MVTLPDATKTVRTLSKPVQIGLFVLLGFDSDGLSFWWDFVLLGVRSDGFSFYWAEAFWTSLISRNWCRNLLWEKTIVDYYLENILILCCLSRSFCLSGLMNGKINKKPSKCRDGSRNGVVGEVGLRRVALGSQANTIWQRPSWLYRLRFYTFP